MVSAKMKIPSTIFENHPHCGRAYQYAVDIVDGKIPAGRYTRLACQRHLDDLDREFDYVFDMDKAERACRFIEQLPHTKGRWAARREKLILHPSQSFFISSIFGWVHAHTGLRRFFEVFYFLPRKNAKSVTAAAIGLYCLCADGEYGAEVYTGAGTEKQAWEVFKPARLMALKTPALRDRFGLSVHAKALSIEGSGATFQPLIGNPGDGSSPSCAIADEYHEHKSDSLYQTMVTGMGAREQPIMLIPTTAGFDLGSPCFEKYQDCIKILEGDVIDDSTFVLIYHADDPENWDQPEEYEKANPLLGVSVSREYLEKRLNDAKLRTKNQNSYKTKHLNLWVGAQESYFNAIEWAKCADTSLNIADFEGEMCVMALDMASRRDFTAKAVAFPKIIDGVQHFYLFFGLYIPRSRVDMDDTGRYARWEREGWITVTPGNELDFRIFTRDVLDEVEIYQHEEVAYDPAHAIHLAQILDENSVPVIEFKQNTVNMGLAMDDFSAAMASGRIHHDGNPAIAWMISNVINTRPRAKLPFPGKLREVNKIDGPIAGMMACARGSYLLTSDGTSCVGAAVA